ncbi:hypothetical protein FISHEDRAFT_53643 [Fistulina hepatica ATCC 64428]|nr:hypothetical protein FISHEDRAFT_53643 [Fistulina hepatica ATCC 64428]
MNDPFTRTLSQDTVVADENEVGIDKCVEAPPDFVSRARVCTNVAITDSPVGKRLPLREVTVNASVIPEFIPPSSDERPRTLVLCFDGTGDQFDADNSNIVKFFSLLKKDDKSAQVVYYQACLFFSRNAGIGTYTSPKIATPFMSQLSKVSWDLDAHVMGEYEFLMQNYTVGDNISIFGFSRGAYTARSLAGMIHKVGLIPSDNFQQVPFAYKMYTRTDDVGWRQSRAFKNAFSRNVTIDFVGVWDTVDSVGIIPKRLPFTISNSNVRIFRQALSLDEHRVKFKANLWNHATEDEKALDREFSPSTRDPTDVKEVWFAGCHCDVGGGSVDNDTPRSLARIPLRWMIRECFKTNSNVIFHSDRLGEVGLDPSTLYPSVLARPPPLNTSDQRWQTMPPELSFWKRWFSRSANQDSIALLQCNSTAGGQDSGCVDDTEEMQEREDALSPIYDELEIDKWWWILESLPIAVRHQKADNEWVWSRLVNWGHPRRIVERNERFMVHRSVLMRMQALGPDGLKYIPRAKFPVPLDQVHWVD